MIVSDTVQRVIFVGVNLREKPEMAFRNNFCDSNIRGNSGMCNGRLHG